MTHTFTIVPAADKVALDEQGRGQLSVTVCNTAEKPARGAIKLAPLGSTRQEWLKVAGESVRVFSNRQSHQFTVEIQLPSGVSGGRYTFRPNVATVENPEVDYTEGPELVFEFKGKSEPEPKKDKKFPLWIFFVVLGVVLVGGGITVALLLPKGKTTVASVLGKNRGEATHLLEQAKFKVVAEEEVTRTNAPGSVFAQSPAAGQKAKEGSTITLTVEGQPVTVKVPDLVGMPFAKVKDAFASLNLEFVQKDQRLTGKVPAGNILEQLPLAGDLASANSQIGLTVEGESVAVPGVTGLGLDRASDTLRNARLSIGSLTKENRTDMADDTVIRTVPPAGERVPPGSTVQVVVSEKPAAPTGGGGPKVIGPNIFGSRLILMATPPAPTLVAPANGTVFHNFPRRTTLQWAPVAGATSYTVELDCLGCCGAKWCTDMGRAWRIVPNVSGTSYTFDFVGAQPGRWRVWAVNSTGRAGLKSQWREFRYTR